jgi:hypothetical protein
MAERVGFEPTSPVLPGYPLSRRALSTAQTPLPTESLTEGQVFSNAASGMWLAALSARGKKGLHCAGAFIRQHAAENFHAMVERRMAEDLKT